MSNEETEKSRTGDPLVSRRGFVIRAAQVRERVEVEALLRAADLPLEGVGDHFEHFVVAVDGECVLGAAGLEVYGDVALLRSVVVAPESRRSGAGRALTERLVSDAVSRGVRELYLLTTTAPRYFERLGFARCARDALPAELGPSAELRGACPASAVALRLELAPSHGSPNTDRGSR